MKIDKNVEKFGGINQLTSPDFHRIFKKKNVKDKGKEAFVCAFDTKCMNRCPRNRKKIECWKRRGLCVDDCGG